MTTTPRRVALTARSVPSLATPDKGRINYLDVTLPGFGVRVSSTGVRTYFARYRRANGTERRYTIGKTPPMTLKSARDQAKRVLEDARLGEDPAAARAAADRPVGTLAELALRFVEFRSPKIARSTESEYRRMVKAYLRPAAGGPARPAAELVGGDVEELLERVARRSGPVQANRLFQLVRAVCRWSWRKGFIPRDRDPSWGVDRPRDECTRDRVLQDHEIKSLWQATDLAGAPDVRMSSTSGHQATAIPRKPGTPGPAPKPKVVMPAHAAAARLQLLLGTRPTELLKMRWVDLDLDAGHWTIPAKDRKGETAHVVPLSPTARRIIEGMRELTGSQARVLHGAEVGNWIRWFGPLRERAIAAGAASFTRHDLRRTCATGCARMGAPEDLIGRILGHKRKAGVNNLAGIYNRYDRLPELAAALNAWAAHVEQIVTRKDGAEERRADVVPIRR